MQEGGKQDTLTITVPTPDANRQNVHMHRQDSMDRMCTIIHVPAVSMHELGW